MIRLKTVLALLVLFALSSIAFAATEKIGPRIKLQAGEITVSRTGFVVSDEITSKLATVPMVSPAGKEYLLVQFDGPITREDRSALEASGARVYEYVPDFAFLVSIDSSSKGRLGSLRRVLGFATYLPRFKIDASFSALHTSSGLSQNGAGRNANRLVITPTVADVIVVGFKGESLQGLISALTALGGRTLDSSETEHKLKIRALVPSDKIEDISSLPAVRWIEMTPEWVLWNNLSANDNEMDVRDVRDTHGLRGSGQIVAIADTGLDQGYTTPTKLHDDFEDGSGSSRVIALLDIAGDNKPSDAGTYGGHGTHVAGSILGNGAMSGSTPSSHIYPSTCFAGMAPESQVVFQASMNNTNGGLYFPIDLNTLFNQARSYGAWVHSNSWGSSIAGSYTSNSQDVDENVWANQDYCILFSAGNSGVDADRDGKIDEYSIGSPATAKNCIAVGAAENYRPSGGGYSFSWGSGWSQHFNTNPIFSDHVSNNVAGMAAFSSRGPCLDGRRKPDIVAPGTNIVSTKSSGGLDTLWGTYDSNYLYCGGTSMSTPLTSGSAVLVRDYFARGNYPGIASPSAALVKAILLNGATDLAPGQYTSPQEIPVRPNNVEGWGRVDLEDSLFNSSAFTHRFLDNRSGLNTAGEFDYDICVTDSSKPLRVTLAWSDYPGSLSYGGGLVNDLDLNVIAPDSSVIYPNNASQRGASRFMTYTDSNMTYGNALTVGSGYAVKFTPASYPYYLDAARLGVYNSTTSYSRYPFTVNVYGMSGSLPGSLLGSTSGSAVLTNGSAAFVTVPFTPITISSGSFFIEFRAVTGSPNIVSTNVSPNSVGNDFYFNGSTWSAYSYDVSEDLDIDAVGHLTDYVTSNDRVNNVEGVDVASPALGSYRIRIQGYNVPYGPQPFAVVISGNLGTLPVAPSSAVVDRDNLCASDAGSIALSVIGGTGTALRWFDDTCGGHSIGTGNPLVIASPETTMTYYARWESPCGNSSCASVTVTVLPWTAAPISVHASPNAICPGESSRLSAVVGPNQAIEWFVGSCGGTPVPGGESPIVSPTVTTSYFARAVDLPTGCVSKCVSVTVMVSIKKQEDNTAVSLLDKPITYTATGVFYVEDDTRSFGIRVENMDYGLSAGMRADISGTMRTNTDKERYIEATTVTRNGTGILILEPLTLNNKAIGGGDWLCTYGTTAGQVGVTGGLGLNNVGLLVRAWGRVTQVGLDYLYIDDGSGLLDGTFTGPNANKGIKVICYSRHYTADQYLIVTGISSCYKTPSGLIAPKIVTRNAQDILPVSTQ